MKARHIQMVFVILGSLGMISLFQNCSGVNFSDVASVQSKAGDDSGAQDLGDDSDTQNMVDDGKKDDGKKCDDKDKKPPYVGPAIVPDKELNEIVIKNVACTELFTKIDLSKYVQQSKMHVHGISSNISAAKILDFQVSGISKSIAAKEIGVAKISGIHGSLCLEAEAVDGISGILYGSSADVFISAPAGKMGRAAKLSGINNSDLVLMNYEVEHISGIGRSLHVYGGRVGKISGIFQEIHLYNGAVVDDLNGINKGIVRH